MPHFHCNRHLYVLDRLDYRSLLWKVTVQNNYYHEYKISGIVRYLVDFHKVYGFLLSFLQFETIPSGFGTVIDYSD